MSEVPTLPDWQSRRRSSSGVRIIEHSEPTLDGLADLVGSDDVETLPRARRSRSPEPEADVATLPRALRSTSAPAPRLIPIDLDTCEPVTVPLAERPQEPVLDGDDEVPTYEIVAPLESDIVELISVDDDDEAATLPRHGDVVFDLDSLLSDVDSFESAPPFPSAACSWPARVERQPASAPVASFPGRPFGSAIAPTSQTDRPEGPSVGARAVSVLVAVAVVSLVLLAAAMMVTDKSGMEAFTELYALGSLVGL